MYIKEIQINGKLFLASDVTKALGLRSSFFEITKNDNQIIKLLNELKSIDNILLNIDLKSYKELKNINLLIELKLKFDYSIKDDYKRVYNYCLQEKELIKNILNIIKNNNFNLEDPLEKNDNYIYLVLKKNLI